MKTAHLVKVIVQTVWVEVDSETGNAAEQVGPAVSVTADAWPTFYPAWQKAWEDIAGSPKAPVPEAPVLPAPLRAVPMEAPQADDIPF